MTNNQVNPVYLTVSILSFVMYVSSTFFYTMFLFGIDVESYDGIIIAMTIIGSLLVTSLKWSKDVQGVYSGKHRFLTTRMVFLWINIAIIPINFIYFTQNQTTIILGFSMVFSLLTFYSYYYGKKHGTLIWFKFY